MMRLLIEISDADVVASVLIMAAYGSFWNSFRSYLFTGGFCLTGFFGDPGEYTRLQPISRSDPTGD